MKRPKIRRPGRSLLLRDRAPEPETVPMGRYPYPATGWQTAPVGPARTRPIGGRGWTGAVNDAPASAADHMDDRCRAAHAYLKLEVDDLKAQGMLYRVDDADQVRERGEELDERSVIAQTVAKATRHLLGHREPWQPGPWPPPASAWTEYRPEDPSGVRAAYERAFNGNGAA